MFILIFLLGLLSLFVPPIKQLLLNHQKKAAFRRYCNKKNILFYLSSPHLMSDHVFPR
nr:MAG TPA: hypothetical protein [Caudoviricetes sp.]